MNPDRVVVAPMRKMHLATVLMAVGLAPVFAWVVFLGSAIEDALRGQFELGDFLLAGMGGAISYLFAVAVAGGACLWAGRLSRRAAVRKPFITVGLRHLTVAVVISPWLGIAALSLWRAFE